MRQYMMSIPDSLIEAARIDGAGEWKIFSKIVLPISSPSIGALAILQFLSKWNELLYPKIMLTKQKLMRMGVRLLALPHFRSLLAHQLGAGAFRLYAGHNPFNYRIPHVPG